MTTFFIIAGQGTAAVELLEEMPEPDAVLAPVGGGGLLSGSAIPTRHLAPKDKNRTGPSRCWPTMRPDRSEQAPYNPHCHPAQ